MKLLNVVKGIIRHPLNRKYKAAAIWRFARWQVNNILNPYPVIYPFTEKSFLILQKGMAGATGNLYCGLHDFHEMAFMLHFLRKQDLFIDIGANVGSYTVLASAHSEAKSISVEPVPSTFMRLEKNIALNQVSEKVRLLNMALGSRTGNVKFTSSFDAMNHVALETDIRNNISVNVDTLDNILSKEAQPILIKIDVEGFETEVLKGAKNTLAREDLKAIIIELNGSGANYGFDETQIHRNLIELGFEPYSYDPLKRSLLQSERNGSKNVIYIRDLYFVQQRLLSAEKIKILNQEF